jgi:hypothetical protein
MERSSTPYPFYGAAVAALLGLAMGLALHGPWQSRAGGPQILFASAAATELARPMNDTDIIEAAAPIEQTAYADLSVADTGQLPADPPPVMRLTRRGGAALPAQADFQRVSADAIDQDTRDDDVSAFHKDIADAEPSPRFASSSLASVSYTTSSAGF